MRRALALTCLLGCGSPQRQALAEAGRSDDGDGIEDARDLCPAEAEDRDGFSDEDGCPDDDDDADGLVDRCDACPRDPETWNGDEDADGCPDRGVTIVEGDENATASLAPIATGCGETLPPEALVRLDALAGAWRDPGPPLTVASLGTPGPGAERAARARAAQAFERLERAGISGQRLEVVVVDRASACELVVRLDHDEAPPLCDPLTGGADGR